MKTPYVGNPNIPISLSTGVTSLVQLDGLMLRINLCGAIGVIDFDRFLSGIKINPHHHWAILSTLVCPNTQHTRTNTHWPQCTCHVVIRACLWSKYLYIIIISYNIFY